MKKSAKWLTGAFGSAAGVGILLGTLVPGGAVNAAQKAAQTHRTSRAASSVAPRVSGSLGDQVEEADTMAIQALNGGHVAAISRVSGPTSQWVVTVHKNAKSLNVVVDVQTGKVLKVAQGNASANAIH